MKGLRTVAISAALALFGVLESADWVNLIGEETAGPVVIGIAAVMAALRAMTSTPLGKKE